MVNEFAHITIVQDSKNGYKIKLTGNSDNILTGLASAVNETIKEIPKEYQQKARVNFLHYLNEATIHAMEE